MTPAEVLEATAARLEEKGWQRGSYGGPDGPNCVVGAIRQQFAEPSVEQAAIALLVHHLAGTGFPALGNWSRVVDWNDSRRDKRVICRTLRRVARDRRRAMGEV